MKKEDDGIMGLYDKINTEMVLAAKGKDKLRLSVVRLIKTGLHNREIDLKRPLNDDECLQLLSAMVKQRRDSIEQFRQGRRMDLVEKEEGELGIIQSFMPEQMSEEDIAKEIENAVREVGAVSIKDMGKVMKVLMPKLTGRADGKLVGDKVKARLSA
ncbi:MAG: GatB/YqeY domain-containing protein [Deltaproteobacteria bacterium]|nr:GatB/YqeY domain-containing protein [Deltaproteobacteria bacterium]